MKIKMYTLCMLFFVSAVPLCAASRLPQLAARAQTLFASTRQQVQPLRNLSSSRVSRVYPYRGQYPHTRLLPGYNQFAVAGPYGVVGEPVIPTQTYRMLSTWPVAAASKNWFTTGKKRRVEGLPHHRRIAQEKIAQSEKEILEHDKAIEALKLKIVDIERTIAEQQQKIEGYEKAIKGDYQRFPFAGEKRHDVLPHKLAFRSTMGHRDLIRRAEQKIENEQHHLASLRATLKHQEDLKAVAAAIPEQEALRNAEHIDRLKQHILRADNLVEVASDSNLTNRLVEQLKKSSVADKEQIAYHFVDAQNIGSLVESPRGLRLLQELIGSANQIGLDTRVIRETIAINSINARSIDSLARTQSGVDFLQNLISGYIGKNNISELLVDSLGDADAQALAADTYGAQFLKALWSTGNKYVQQRVGQLVPADTLQTLQESDSRMKKAYTAFMHYLSSWGATQEAPASGRVQ